jgi:sarcosine oxidase, subunit gamma
MADWVHLGAPPTARGASTADRRPAISIQLSDFGCARYSLRIDPASAVELNAVAGFTTNIPINRAVAAGDWISARLGPDEWMLLSVDGAGAAIEQKIEAALAGVRFFSLVDVSHRDLAIAVSGRYARDVINGGCPLDLDEAAFPVGSASRTVLGKAEIVLLRLGAEQEYRIELGRSFVSYVQTFLNEVAREFI